MSSAAPLSCVITNGGPLILLPRQLVEAWRGVLPPLGVTVPEGWEWGDGGVVCDYDRAGTPPDDVVRLGDSHGTWTVAVAGSTALVLEGEVGTTAVAWKGGLVVIRDAQVETEDGALAILAAVDDGEWHASSMSLDLTHGGLSMFDAAYAGVERHDADGGLLEAELAPDTYRVLFAARCDRVTLVRLVRVGQEGGGAGARVTIT